jgi:hypothetical protein
LKVTIRQGGPAPGTPGGSKTFWRANAQAAPGYV